ncbi:hypothetical protein C5167_011003 [Papaver somniferum]|uniref:Thioredoxin domain-containing protein n=1 Tax=Papaver somniferum TaxID=3469 RepID=A0A4Y7K5P5_PAPSO|nr:thioredoxin M3, chloroplastic-like [Papaver somniferum]RZC67315.1 hypothetical protein C5167_011003 [Papaver somniferum]
MAVVTSISIKRFICSSMNPKIGLSSRSLHLKPREESIRFPVNPVRYTSSSLSLKKKYVSKSVIVASIHRAEPEVVTEDTWDECVLNSDIPVIVEFWASWCGPCRMVHREIEEIANEYVGKIKCYKLRADVEFKIAEKYGVKAVPIVLFFKNGEKSDSVIGTMPKHVYTAAIDKLLTSSS